MAKVKDNEQQPEVIDSEQKSDVLTLDEVEYDIADMTDVQKEIVNDIKNYQAQQNRLERWKQGQVYILKVSLNGQSEEKVEEEVEAEA